MEKNSSRKWLYDKFVAKGLNVGKDYAQFDSLMTNNEESRKWVYSKARQMGLNVGKDYAQFDSIINPVIPPKEGVEADRANIAETTEIPKPTELNVADVATEADIEENRVFRDNFERELGVDRNYLELGKQVADDLIEHSRNYPLEARTMTQQAIAEDVKKAFEDEQKKGDEEARRALTQPINGGFVPVYSGLAYGMQRAGEVAKATDIEPMIGRVMENIFADETKVEEAMKPYLDAGYSESEAIQAASDDLASGIQRTIFDEYKKQNAPKDVTSYILGSVFRNNIVSQLAQGLARVSGGASGLNEQIKDEVYAEAGEQAGMLPRVAAGVGTLIADAPVFGGLGSVSANVAKGITEFGSKQFAKRIIGASGKAGIDAGSRYVGSSLTGRMVQGALASGGTLGSYDALAEMSRQMRTGVGEVSDIAGQFGHGFLMGAALAPIGVGSRYLSRNMSKTGKMMMDAGAFVTEAELFNLPNVIENPLDFGAHAEGFVESAATLGLMKGSHKLPKLATSEGRKSLRDEIKARYNSPDYINKARFTKEELAELKEQGYDLKELFKSDEASRSNGEKGKKGALVERGVEEVDVETVRREEDRGDIELLDNYVKMMRDTNVPMELKAKMAYRVEGRITANMPRATWVELKQNDNRYIVTTHDAMGNPISRKTFGGKREAENLYKEMEQVCESNSINIIEEITDRRSEERATTKALLDMGVQSSAEAQSIMSRIGELRNKKTSERTDEENNELSSFEVRVKRYQITEESSAGIRAGIERESGLKIADILQKPANKRTLDEVATLAKYRRELMRSSEIPAGSEELGVERVVTNEPNGEKGLKGENEDEPNRGNVGGEESESIKVAETTEIPKPTELNVATEADKVRKERSFNIEKLRGKAASIDDVVNLYGNSLGGRDYIMTYPEDYAEVIDRLETEREMAIAWSKGEPAVEKPDNWEYWKEREGLNERVVTNEPNGEKGLKGENEDEPNRANIGSDGADRAKKTNRTNKANRGVTLPDGSDVTSIVCDSSKLSERIMSQYVDAPREVRDIIEPITDMREPLDVEDIVYERLSSLRSPNTRYKLVLNSVGGVKGVSDELGLPAKELQRMLGFNAFALPANGGISLQKMAESIVADINDGVYAGISNAEDSAVRDMLIEAIRSAGEPADISYHRARRRIALAQSVYDDYVREVRAEEERYAAEEDAYNAYIENWLVEAEKGYNELPKNYFENIFADEERLRQEEYEQRNIDAGNQSGSKVLLGERLSERGRTEEGKDGQGLRGTVGEDMSRGANAVAQSREAGGVAEREVGAERQLGVEADRANELNVANMPQNAGTSLFQYFSGSLSELISRAKQSAEGLIKKIIAPVSSRLKEDLSRQGVVVDEEYKHVIDNNAIRHTLKKHSGNNEYKRGQIPIAETDFDRIADVVEDYDAVEVIAGKTPVQRIIYHKAYPDGTVMFVEEQRVGRKELAAVTMWKKKIPTRTDANRTETTLISDLNEVSVGKDTVNSVKVNDLGVENDVLSVQEQVKAAESEVNTNPTEAQKEAGNYKKGHVQIGKFNITIEQPKGSVRRGVDANGNKWESEMQNTYGYIRGTEGVDGDHIDVFLSEDIDGWNGKQVFVVDQYNEDGSFDEHKVMLGFNKATEAHKAYLSNYSKDWSSKHKNIVTSVSIENFEKWIDSSHRKTKAFAEYKIAERQLGVRKEELGVGAEGVRERVAEWGGRIGAKVRVIERPEEIDNFPARVAIEKGLNISGWYDVNSGDVCIYAPNVRDVREVDRTIVHEVVSHKGLRGMLGEKAFDKLCDKTWDMMSDAERAEYESYPGVEKIEDDEKRRRAAADEYISHLAEGVDLSEAERSTWRKVMDTIMDFLKKLYSDIKLTEKDLEEIIKASYRRLRVEAEKGDKGIKGVKGSDVEGVKPIGRGVFGNIYDQFRGKAKEAVQFLLNRKEGEAIGALHHPEVGDIDLVWGKEGTGKSDGFGLAKLAKYHPEVLDNIQEILDDMHVTQRTVNRVQMESDTHQAAVRLTWDNEQKNWLLTAFEKRNSVFDNTTDTAETSKQGKRNDTTTSQSTVSVGKDTGNSVKVNDLGEKNRSERLSRMPKPPYSIGQIQVAEGRGERELVDKMWKETQDYIEKELTSKWIPEIENTIKELNNVTMGSDLKVNKSSVGYKYQQLLKNRLRELTKEVKGDRGALIEYSEVAPKGLKWREVVKYKDPGYRWSTVQLQPSGEDLWVRLSGTYKGNPAGQVLYYKIPNYKSLSWNDVILSAIDEGIATRHFEDAVLNFYVSNRINPYSILRPMELPKRAERVSDRKTKRQSEDDVRFRGGERKWYGGNSGYEGYSMSVRAAEAREEGRYPKTDFKKEYGLTDNELKALVEAGIVSDKEWHHTSKYGNKTVFYGFENKGAIDFYNSNKARIKSAIKDGKIEALISEFDDAVQSHYDAEYVAMLEKEAKRRQYYNERSEYADYITSQLPATYTAVNGVVVELNGSLNSSRWVASIDGTRLSKRNGKGSRDTAFAEASKYIAESFPSFEEWKAGREEVRFRVEPIMGNERIFEGLRKLEDGETSYVERKFSENKNFEFNSKNFIKGYDDVAYIFKQLENESVENAFAVLVKKGRPTVIHLGMGGFTQSMVNKAGLNVAVNRIKPDKIYFVHNHPSGVLKSSNQDQQVLNELVLSYGSDVVQYGIIINSFTGRYGIFSSDIEGISYSMPSEQPGERPIKVYSFNKMVYDKNYQPTTTLRSGSDVAAFITSQRLGDRQKLGLLVVDNQLRITGNVFLPYSDFTHENADKIANDIAYYTTVMGGTRAFLFGNTSMSKLSDKNLSGRVRDYTGGQIQMLDYVEIDGGRYKSAYEDGVRFRFIGNRSNGENMSDSAVRTVGDKANENFYFAKGYIDGIVNAKNAVDSYRRNFKALDRPAIDIINSLEDLYDYALSVGAEAEEAEEFAEYVKSKKTVGSYSSEIDKIIIFAWRGGNPYLTTFHENVHRAVTRHGGADKFPNLVSELKVFDPRLLRRINKSYNPEEVDDEIIAYTLEAALAGNAIKELQGYLSETAYEELDKILNYIGYDEGRNSESDAERFVTEENSGEFERVRRWTRGAIERRGRGGRRLELGGLPSRKREQYENSTKDSVSEEKQERVEVGAGKAKEDLYLTKSSQIADKDIRFREREEEEREVIGELGGGVPWGDGETLADAMSRVRRKRNRLVIDIDNMERRREAGKPIDERAYDDAKAELAQAEKELRYMEIGPEKPELAEGESETDASYVARMEHWREQLLEWKGKKYDEDEYMDSFLRNATGERADMSDEELHKLLESEKDKRNTSIKEMKKLIKEQIRERRRNIEVSNWEDEVTIKNIKDKTTQEERELISHILEGSYSILPSKDMRYAEYLEELRVRNEELGIEFEELEEYDTRKVESSNYNAQATSNSAGLRNSDIVEYAVDSGNATFYVSIDGNRALLKMGNGDVYPLNIYDIRYLYWLYDRLPQEKKTGIGLYGMGTEQEQLLGMFLRGEAEWILPKGIREYKEGKEYDAGLLATVKEIRDWYDEAWEILNREGMTYGKESIDRYVTHIWDLKKSTPHAIETLEKFLVANEPTAVKDIDNYISTNTPYMRTRAIASILDGMEFGLVPKYKDITDIMRDYGHRMNEAVENRRLINFVKGLRVNGMDAIREAGKHNDGVYVLIDNNALRGYEVHRDVKPVLDIVFGKLHTTDNVILQNIGHYYDMLSGVLKKLNLSLSFFHHLALSETAVSMMGPVHAGKTIFKNIMWDAAFKGHLPAFNDVELTRDAVKHFVQLGATQDYAAKDIKDLTARLAQWAEGKLGVEELATIVDFWNKGMDTVLWEYLHDGFKIYGYGKLAGEIRAKAEKEGWSEETLERALDEAGQLINDTYGGQHWDLLGWSPNTVRWGRRVWLSLDWTISTLRQALSPFGIGQLYNDDKFWKKWFKNDPVSRTRKKYGRAFWLTFALVFIPLMNGLNAYFRMKDEEEESKKAEEERKTNPDYKSPYELVYPDGMKWWDYTMLGNTIGHQTHLFGGRYEDGKEMYVRWGKQFRELPELFIGRDGVGFPQPMIDKIVGKLNPTINLVTNLTSGYSLTGFQNSYMKNKRGWEREIARVHVLISSFLPYSIPTDEEKEFKLSDLTMPSTKGFSAWKAIDKFKVAIASGDVNFVGQVYDACVMNGLDAESLLDVAIKQIEVAAKKEMIEGVEDVADAINQYDSESNPVRRMQLKRYILKQMSAQDYKYISREEALEEALAFIESGVTEKNMSDYDAISTSNDLIEDWRLRKAKAGLKPYWDEYRKLREEDSGAAIEYYERNMEYIEKYREFNRATRWISKYKKDLGKGKDEEVMGRIRKERKGALGEI